MRNMISKANKNTDEINVLLEYVDYFGKFGSINEIISQYDPEARIGDISENLIIAFNKLDLYVDLIQTAVRVSGAHYHL